MEKTSDKIISEIVEIYKPQIKIPKIKPEKQFFLCPVGLIGSGKTTVLNLLSERLSLVKISGDEIRKILKDRGYGYDLTWNIGKVLIQEFANKIEGELLPLERNTAMTRGIRPKYESITLPDALRGNIAGYQEVIYESPIMKLKDP